IERGVAPRDILEMQLKELWEELLLTADFGVKDNFFELGGSSLIALRLMAEIQQRTGKTLPLDALIQKPTIEHMAEVLREQTETEAWSPLVAIQPRGSNRPLFCVHAVDGYVAAYLKLAARLGTEQPCYGLQARGLDHRQEPLTHV